MIKASTFKPGSYISLLVSLLALTVLSPIVDRTAWGDMTISWVVIFLMVSAAVAVSPSRADRTKFIIFTVISSLIWGASRVLPFSPFNLMGNSGCLDIWPIIVFLSITAYMMLRHIISSNVSHDTICGAICVYMLIGTTYTMIYASVLDIDPSAVSFNQSLGSSGADTSERFSQLMYFSFCTYTTLGYGDITPVHRTARMFACRLEAVTGQLYLTILVARLVGLHIAGGEDSCNFIGHKHDGEKYFDRPEGSSSTADKSDSVIVRLSKQFSRLFSRRRILCLRKDESRIFSHNCSYNDNTYHWGSRQEALCCHPVGFRTKRRTDWL